MSTLVDAHAHFHQSYSLPEFLSAAANNFKCFGAEEIADAKSVGVLTVCETTERDPLHAFRTAVPSWDSSTPDEHSIVFSKLGEPTVVVVAGRQIVTNEKLELLALFTSASLENGLPLSDSVDAVLASDAVPVIPWGFGKWTFQRGTLLSAFLRSHTASGTQPAHVMLGDSGCRINGWRPSILKTAESLGFYVTAGSDPLRLSEHVRRPGSYGTVLRDDIDINAPTAWLRDRLRRVNESPQTFGRCRNVIEFVRDQVRLRLEPIRARHG